MLKDQFGRTHDYLRISLTDSCNLRCTYCMPEHPAFFQKDQLLSLAELHQLAEIFVEEGVRKIRLTGGEPLVRPDFAEILFRLNELRTKGLEEITLTTNGIFIDKYIRAFQSAGIQSVNVSLDSLLPERFEKITLRNQAHRVLSNIHLLLQHNFQVKLNAVVMRGTNDDEVNDFVRMTRDYPLHVRFIEFMPFSGNGWKRENVVSAEEILDRLKFEYEIIPLERKAHETSRKFNVLGYEGTFAFISTMTEPFCSDCNRLRLTADGKMKNCLFSKGEIDLRAAIRNGNDVGQMIRENVFQKASSRGGQMQSELMPPDGSAIENRAMVRIGG